MRSVRTVGRGSERRTARSRPRATVAQAATFLRGDAMALPFEPDRFDAAVMALVIFFIPDPARAIAEMVRVVRPGGWVAAYAWDVLGGGFPLDPIWEEIRALGLSPLLPPNPDAGRLEALRELWTAGGLQGVETCAIVVKRTFSSFEECWATSTTTEGVRSSLEAISLEQRGAIKARVRTRVPADPIGRVTWRARAHTRKGARGTVGINPSEFPTFALPALWCTITRWISLEHLLDAPRSNFDLETTPFELE